MNIFPIRNDEDHDRALARISEIMDAKLGSPEGEELEILSTLVDAYESKHHAIEAPDPIAAINFRMEQAGYDRKNIEEAFGTRGRTSEILNGKRCLSLSMIRKLHYDYDIPLGSLITPNECNHAECDRDSCHKVA